MKVYQYRDFWGAKNGKIHLRHYGKFLCGRAFVDGIDINDPNEMEFSKGICQSCKNILKNKYSKDLNFEVIKLKLGVR